MDPEKAPLQNQETYCPKSRVRRTDSDPDRTARDRSSQIRASGTGLRQTRTGQDRRQSSAGGARHPRDGAPPAWAAASPRSPGAPEALAAFQWTWTVKDSVEREEGHGRLAPLISPTCSKATAAKAACRWLRIRPPGGRADQSPEPGQPRTAHRVLTKEPSLQSAFITDGARTTERAPEKDELEALAAHAN